jgi:hypothetical protein
MVGDDADDPKVTALIALQGCLFEHWLSPSILLPWVAVLKAQHKARHVLGTSFVFRQSEPPQGVPTLTRVQGCTPLVLRDPFEVLIIDKGDLTLR